MRVDELLIATGVADADVVDAAFKLQTMMGGSFYDHLISLGTVKREAVQFVLDTAPRDPASLADTGISESELLNLLMKHMYVVGLDSHSALMEALKLPHTLTTDLIERGRVNQLLLPLGASNGTADARYALSDKGRQFAAEALAQSRYIGPVPVTLASFQDRIRRQKISNEIVTPESVHAAFDGLEVSELFVEQIGPAIQSGRAMLIYGPAGNGKTSVALRITRVFREIVYIPYAVMIDGQIMRVFDNTLHTPVVSDPTAPSAATRRLIAERLDDRWVPCRRPFVVVGGELTLEMLDLKYDSNANFYEAPLHIKATGGCLLIDDFGRQLVAPATLLNRWIVPLESRVDYLKLHTGTTFMLPFETLVILSTNLDPSDLMDPAFLRRIPYKLPVMGPSREEYRHIFDKVSQASGLTLSDDVFDHIVHEITEVHGHDLAAYQPKFLIEQIVAACNFQRKPLRYDHRTIDFAMRNMTVRRPAPGERKHGVVT